MKTTPAGDRRPATLTVESPTIIDRTQDGSINVVVDTCACASSRICVGRRTAIQIKASRPTGAVRRPYSVAILSIFYRADGFSRAISQCRH